MREHESTQNKEENDQVTPLTKYLFSPQRVVFSFLLSLSILSNPPTPPKEIKNFEVPPFAIVFNISPEWSRILFLKFSLTNCFQLPSRVGRHHNKMHCLLRISAATWGLSVLNEGYLSKAGGEMVTNGMLTFFLVFVV